MKLSAGLVGAKVDRAPDRVEWLALAIVVLLAVAALRATVAPGLMTYDSLLFYRQAVDGVTLSTWPPMYAYLIQIVRAVGGTYGGLFLLLNAMVFGFGGYLALSWSGPTRRGRLVALGLFVLSFLAVPATLGTTIVLWNMTAMAGFALAGAALQTKALRSGAISWAVAAALAYAVSFAMRYDALFLVAPLAACLIAWPRGERSALRDRLGLAAVVAAAFALAAVSFSHRLPDFARLAPNNGVRMIQAFDLIGTSAECGVSLITPEMSGGAPMSPQDVIAHYDPRHVNIAWPSRPGARDMVKPNDGRQVNAYWRRAVTQHPGCYLKHRARVFIEQMGLARRGIPLITADGIDANPYGFALAHPERARAVVAFIAAQDQTPWNRPAWLYLLAPFCVLLLAVRRDRHAVALGLAAFSALAYAGSHLFVSSAADARYVFPSSVVCALVIAAAVGVLVGRARRPG